MGPYLAGFAVSTLLFVVLQLGLAWSAVGRCAADWQICALVRYQLAKIEALPARPDTLFIGDSSLGNALDAGLFAELRRAGPVWNLALTGNAYGVPGAFGVLTRVLERSRPRNVVVMLTPEDYGSSSPVITDIAVQGLATLGVPPWEIGRTIGPVYGLALLYRQLQLALRPEFLRGGLGLLAGARPPPCQGCGALDYVPQVAVDPASFREGAAFPPATANYRPFLRRIQELCAAHAVNCLYLHGTVWAPVAERSHDTVAAINRMVAEAGMPLVVDAPIGVPTGEIGDSINHVRPDAKQAYTRRIEEMLRPYLRPASSDDAPQDRVSDAVSQRDSASRAVERQ
jgi:hypothetical protein